MWCVIYLPKNLLVLVDRVNLVCHESLDLPAFQDIPSNLRHLDATYPENRIHRVIPVDPRLQDVLGSL
jgi:hypothetical protein